MMDDGWLPDTDDGELIGGIDIDGVLRDLRHQTPLDYHPDPRVRRAGEFIGAAPDDIPPFIASMGGLMIGLRLALADPDLARTIVKVFTDRDPRGILTLDDTIESILEGRDDD